MSHRSLCPALPLCLVHEDRPRGRGIEGVDLPHHGQAYGKVTEVTRETAHAASLAADDKDKSPREIGTVIDLLAVHIRPRNPKALLFQRAHGLCNVADTRDGYVFECSC